MAAAEITAIREHLGLNQIQFGQLFGVHQMTVSRWERGKLSPTPYQAALMDDFKKAAQKQEVKNAVAALLVGAGIVAAIFFLLKISREAK